MCGTLFTMKTKRKKLFITLLLLVAFCILIWVGYLYAEQRVINDPAAPKMMTLTLFIQDKEASRTRDCAITKKITREVPQTSGVADASLKILFTEELSQYGVYDKVTITDGVAKIFLKSSNTPAGFPIGSLSSCESGHLLSVIKDTLTQYPTITSIELHSPQGRIEF